MSKTRMVIKLEAIFTRPVQHWSLAYRCNVRLHCHVALVEADLYRYFT